MADALHIAEYVLDDVAATEQHELERREAMYRDKHPMLEVRGKTIILVDDGLATGAATTALRRQGPAHIVVGVPVSSPETCDEFRDEVDDIVCAITPEPLYGVGLWYQDFSPTTDGEVRDLLARSAADQRRRAAHAA